MNFIWQSKRQDRANHVVQAAGFNMYYENIWRNYGIMWIFCIFNFTLVFLFSYLYLGGGKNIKAFFSGSKRREKRGSEAQAEKV